MSRAMIDAYVVITCFWYTIGVVYFLKVKNGWYPDTVRYWLFKLFKKASDKDYGMFFRVIETNEKGEMFFEIPKVSLKNWIRSLWGCSYCVAFWVALLMFGVVDHIPYFIATFLSALSIAAVLFEFQQRFIGESLEPDIDQ